MPYIPPANNTQTGNGEDLYALNASGGIVPDPLIINNLVVTEEAITTNLAVTSGLITLSDTAGNQELQAIGTDLFYDGQLLAKAGDIQNISDWADYPAIADVNVNGKNITDVVDLTTTNIIDSVGLAGTANQILKKSADTNLLLWGDVPAPPETGVSSLELLTGDIALTSTGGSIVISKVGQNINLESVAPAVGDTITGLDTFNIADGGTNILTKAIAEITAKNGLAGEVDILADVGFGAIGGGKVDIRAIGGQLYGEIGLTATEGTVDGVTTGGSINIVANSGSALTTATSKISLNAGGINIYSGITSPFASLFGYTYMNALNGISLVAGAFTSGLQALGTVYLYGINGIVLNSDVYTTALYPYWSGLGPPANLSINGRTTIDGIARVDINNANTVNFDALGSGAITGLQTINGSAYPPTGSGVTSLNSLSGALTLTAGSNINFTTAGNDITINASATATPAVGGAGAIQYSNGAGGFLGSADILYNGTTKITNALGTNFIDMNEVANLNSLAIESSNQVNITGTTLLGLNSSDISLVAGSGLRMEINTSLGTAGQVLTSDGTYTTWQNVVSANNGVPYSLTGTTAGAIIVNYPIGAGDALPQNIFTIISTITFNLPAVLNPTDGIYYDGYNFSDFSANFNSFWGVTYATNTNPTEIEILGSVTNTNNSLNFSNFQQVYLPTNLIIPPTYLTGGGTVTLRIYCRPTSSNHYLTVAPINTARIGIVID